MKQEHVQDEARNKVELARQSFENVLINEKYANIIKDDKHLELLLSLVDGKAGEAVLDIGTGTGYLAVPIAKMNPETRVVGLDIAERVMEKNNATVAEQGISKLEFVSFDGIHYPFEKETFDLMVTRYAFHHFPNVREAIEALAGLLKPGGRILISDPMAKENDAGGVIDKFMEIKGDGHIRFYPKKELEAMFAEYGFVVEQQVVTKMKFPFPEKQEYIDLYESCSKEERELYGIALRDGVVWIGHVEVGNTVFAKR